MSGDHGTFVCMIGNHSVSGNHSMSSDLSVFVGMRCDSNVAVGVSGNRGSH